jgi:hypothetical protein
MSLSTRITERKTVRISCTRNVNKATDVYLDSISIHELKNLLSKLIGFNTKLEELDSFIMDQYLSSDKDEDEIQAEYDNCEQYSDKINICRSLVEQKIQSLTIVNSSNNQSVLGTIDPNQRVKLNLPSITLPKFSGKSNKDEHTCQTFIDTFEQLICNYNLNDTSKFSLLEQQCTDRALAMIKTIKLSNRSYLAAKALLLDSFAEVVPQKFATIKKLQNLKLKANEDPYMFYSQFKNLIDTARDQKIDSDVYLQYFVWNALPISLQDMLVNMSQSTYPEIDQLCNLFIKASDRYVTHQNDDKKTVSSHATNLQSGPHSDNKQNKSNNAKFTKNKKLFCTFCQNENDHSSPKCTVYASVKQRKDRIAELKLCVRCLKSGHSSNNCKFQLRKCYRCNSVHWSFLCDKTTSHNKNDNSNSSSTSSNVVTNAQNDESKPSS